MKDYRLSEIKDICEQQDSCDDCECADVCHRVHKYKFIPTEWDDIEPRDMIELPCKIPMIAINEQALAYQVVYRSILGTGEIVTRIFDNETDADVFLSYCKKRNN